MSTTRNILERVSNHVEESMGVRESVPRPKLSPVPSQKDIGRRPLRGVGTLDITLAIPDPDQPRTSFDSEELAGLAESLRTKGQLQPINVRWSEDLQKWVIIAGERRWRAAQIAGLSTINCVFHDQPLTKSQVLELQLIENLQREDIRPIEEAHAFETLMSLNGWTGKQLAESLRIPASKVSRALALLTLPAEVQLQVDSGQVPARTAYELSRVENTAQQQKMATLAANGQLTNIQVAGSVRHRKRRTHDRSTSQRQVFFADNGWQVAVTAAAPGSYHDIEHALQQALEEVRLRIANNIRL